MNKYKDLNWSIDTDFDGNTYSVALCTVYNEDFWFEVVPKLENNLLVYKIKGDYEIVGNSSNLKFSSIAQGQYWCDRKNRELFDMENNH